MTPAQGPPVRTPLSSEPKFAIGKQETLNLSASLCQKDRLSKGSKMENAPDAAPVTRFKPYTLLFSLLGILRH